MSFALPAILGSLGLLGGIFGKSGASKDKFQQLPTLTNQQQNVLGGLSNQLFPSGQTSQNYQLGQDYLQNILSGDETAYNRFAAPFETKFRQETIPGLAQQFAGFGGGLGGGVGSSSGFAQALGSAGAQHSSNLAALYAQLQQQAANQAFGNYGNLANTVLGTRAFQPAYQPGNIGFGAQALAGLASGAGRGAGQGFGMGLSQIIADALKQKTPEAEKTTGV